MANLIEVYSMLCGLKIEKPFILTQFFPTAINGNYISLHTDSELQAKQYSFFQDIVDLLYKPLINNNIKIMQIGAKNAKQLKRCYCTMGMTNLNQVAYLLQHSSLHLGIDSFPIHVASSFNVPTIGLYGNTYPQQCGAFWGENNTAFCGVPKDKKPSYQTTENPKNINNIKVEDIAHAVFRHLNIDYKSKYKTVYIGSNYPNPALDAVPNNPEALKSFNPKQLVSIRMDLVFNQEVLHQYLSTNPCVIVTDQPIDINLIGHYKKNGDKIKKVFYILNDNHNLTFVKQLRSLNVPFQLLSEKGDDINKYKLIYMDYGLVIEKQYPKLEDFKEFDNIDKGKLYYKSNKFILSGGKIFCSKESMVNDDPVPDFSQKFKKLKFTDNISEEFHNFYYTERVN